MKDIDAFLISLGIFPNLRGFGYVKTAMEIIDSSETKHVKRLYACIADKYKVSAGTVERNIRYAIKHVDKTKYIALGGSGFRNYEFLYTIMYILKKGELENAKRN